MIKFIIRNTIKDYESIENKYVRENYIKLSGVLGIFNNLIIAVIKLFIGFLTNSIAVTVDAFNNVTDIGTSVVAIVGAKLSNRPADANHPHGHGRYEYIGSLLVAFIIFSVGFQLLLSSYDRVINPREIYFNLIMVIILVLSILIKLWMFSYNWFIAKKIKSNINKAVAYDSLGDSLATSLVIISMLASAFYADFPFDGIVGILIAFLIMYSGFAVAKDTISLLLGPAPDPKIVKRIKKIINSDEHIIKTHDLEVHDYGPGKLVASIHAEVPDDVNIVEVHRRIDALEKKVKDEIDVEITIHVDPISIDIDETKKVKKDVVSCLGAEKDNIRIKNFRIARTQEKIIVMFNLELLYEVSQNKHDEIKEDICKKIEENFKNYKVVIDNIFIEKDL